MPLRFVRIAVVANLLLLCGGAFAQMFDGTFSAMGRFGLVELVLQQDGAKVKGVLSGNDLTFQLSGELDPDDAGAAYGTVGAPDGDQFFEAYTDGRHLELYVIGVLPDGSPDWNNVSLLEFDLDTTSQAVSGAENDTSDAAARSTPDPAASRPTPDPAPAPTDPAPPAAAGGNPLAANPLATDPLAGNPLASRDPFAGGWSDGQLTLELEASDGGYQGWITFQGTRYPVTASSADGALSGTFNAGGVDYPFVAAPAGDGLDLESGGARYGLKRSADPSDAAAPPGVQDRAPAPTTPAASSPPDATEPSTSAERYAGSNAGARPGTAAADSGALLATGAYGQLTRDGALAFAEALRFLLAELGDSQSLAGVSDDQIVQALAAGYPTLDPESQLSLANARQIWEQTRQGWAYADLASQREFAYAVLTIAYGEQAAQAALGMSGGAGGSGQGLSTPSADPWVQEQTNEATSCWAAAGCDGYDPVEGFTYESPDGY